MATEQVKTSLKTYIDGLSAQALSGFMPDVQSIGVQHFRPGKSRKEGRSAPIIANSTTVWARANSEKIGPMLDQFFDSQTPRPVGKEALPYYVIAKNYMWNRIKTLHTQYARELGVRVRSEFGKIKEDSSVIVVDDDDDPPKKLKRKADKIEAEEKSTKKRRKTSKSETPDVSSAVATLLQALSGQTPGSKFEKENKELLERIAELETSLKTEKEKQAKEAKKRVVLERLARQAETCTICTEEGAQGCCSSCQKIYCNNCYLKIMQSQNDGCAHCKKKPFNLMYVFGKAE